MNIAVSFSSCHCTNKSHMKFIFNFEMYPKVFLEILSKKKLAFMVSHICSFVLSLFVFWMTADWKLIKFLFTVMALMTEALRFWSCEENKAWKLQIYLVFSKIFQDFRWILWVSKIFEIFEIFWNFLNFLKFSKIFDIFMSFQALERNY